MAIQHYYSARDVTTGRPTAPKGFKHCTGRRVTISIPTAAMRFIAKKEIGGESKADE